MNQQNAMNASHAHADAKEVRTEDLLSTELSDKDLGAVAGGAYADTLAVASDGNSNGAPVNTPILQPGSTLSGNSAENDITEIKPCLIA